MPPLAVTTTNNHLDQFNLNLSAVDPLMTTNPTMTAAFVQQQPVRHPHTHRHVQTPTPKKSRPNRRVTSSNKKKKKKEPTIDARPGTEARTFQQTNQNRGHLRGKTFPLAEQNPNTMPGCPTTRNSAAAAGKTDSHSDKRADDPMEIDGKPLAMPTTKKDLETLLRKIVKRYEANRRKVQSMQGRINALTKEIIQLRKAGGKMALNEEQMKLIKPMYFQKMFRFCKFIQDEDEELDATSRLYDYMFSKEEQDELGKEHKKIWVNTYSSHVTSAVNAIRSDLQSRLKGVFKKYAQENNGKIPSVDDLIR